MTPAQVLREARDIILRDGWIQNAYSSEQGYCVEGAIMRACRHHGMKWMQAQGNEALAAFAPFAKAIGCESRHGALALWGDRPERTVQDVLSAFDRAILIAEGGAT